MKAIEEALDAYDVAVSAYQTIVGVGDALRHVGHPTEPEVRERATAAYQAAKLARERLLWVIAQRLAGLSATGRPVLDAETRWWNLCTALADLAGEMTDEELLAAARARGENPEKEAADVRKTLLEVVARFKREHPPEGKTP